MRLLLDFSASGATRLLDRVVRRIDRRRRLMGLFADDFADVMDDVFAKGGPTGDRWEPNDPSTVARKGSDQVGVDSRLLLDSLTSTVGSNVTRRVREDEFVVGTTVPYARAFAKSRQLLPDDDVLTDRWTRQAEDYFSPEGGSRLMLS